jgi:hypothetical protein
MPSYMRRRGGELWASRQEFIRWQLPYGIWRCADGREVLFDRDYAPICSRYPGETPKLSNPREWVHWIDQVWLYNDAVPEREKLKRARAKLDEWEMLEAVMESIPPTRRSP